jgi:hypothetical protein
MLAMVIAMALGPDPSTPGDESDRRAPTAEWTEIALWQVFAMAVPPGTVFRARRNIASWVGDIQGMGFDVSVEYGFRGQIGWMHEGRLDIHGETTEIDGYAASLVEGGGDGSRPKFIAVQIEIPGPSCHTTVCPNSDLGLILSGEASREDEKELILRMYKSIHFINARRF